MTMIAANKKNNENSLLASMGERNDFNRFKDRIAPSVP
jgi:hypothetical protein